MKVSEAKEANLPGQDDIAGRQVCCWIFFDVSRSCRILFPRVIRVPFGDLVESAVYLYKDRCKCQELLTLMPTPGIKFKTTVTRLIMEEHHSFVPLPVLPYSTFQAM